MLSSAADYEYITTTGIEPALVGKIIPEYDLSSLQAPIRFEDFCYLCESIRVWSYNNSQVRNYLNPRYVQQYKYALMENGWDWVYDTLKTSVAVKNRGYGCTLYLNDGITQMPTLPRFDNSVSDLKGFFGPLNLLYDPTPKMDSNCRWLDTSGHLNLPYKPYDVIVPKLLYWVLFGTYYQEVYAVPDSSTTSYDKSYSFCQYAVKSGPATWHTSSGGVISTVTGSVVNSSNAYVDPIIQISTRTTQVPLALLWYRYYGTSSGQYESGYEYCYDGVDGDVESYIDFRRDDIMDAYALVQYVATNNNTYRQRYQFKLEKLTQESGRRWYFKSIDKNFATSLMEDVGADFTKVGTRSPRNDGIPRFHCRANTSSIFVKFNHKFKTGIEDSWQWTPPQN